MKSVISQSSNKNSNFATDEFSFKENRSGHEVLDKWPKSPSPLRSKIPTYKKIHLCDSCIEEGCSDMDSEGYECFGYLHQLKLNDAKDNPGANDENISDTKVTEPSPKVIYYSLYPL